MSYSVPVCSLNGDPVTVGINVMNSPGSSENTRLLSRRYSPTNGTPGPVSSHQDSYEELFKDSVPCPSCRGLGRVPKELENQLVALIPMKDGRLKPRRTLLYVAIAVLLCMITAGLLIFFLLPRNINISSSRPFLQPSHIDLNKTAQFANFTVVNRYNVSNNNFYSVKISGIVMKAFYSDAVIAQSQGLQNIPVEISARSKKELHVPIDFVLDPTKHGSLVDHCVNKWSWIHNLPILFEVTANYTYMGHSEQAFLQTFQTVSCYPEPPTTTPKPTTTTTTTTTTKRTTTPKPSLAVSPPSTAQAPEMVSLSMDEPVKSRSKS